jgi:hypothetical protein
MQFHASATVLSICRVVAPLLLFSSVNSALHRAIYCCILFYIGVPMQRNRLCILSVAMCNPAMLHCYSCAASAYSSPSFTTWPRCFILVSAGDTCSLSRPSICMISIIFVFPLTFSRCKMR